MTAADDGTPRTNAVAFDAWQTSSCNGEVVEADFARSLEREISVLQRALQFYVDPSRYQPINARFVHGEIHDKDRGAVAFNALLETRTATKIEVENK